MKKIFEQITYFVIAFILLVLYTVPAFAVGNNALSYELGNAVNTGKDNGYSGNNEFESSDPHYGWTLGSFVISGYTRVINTESDTPVFIKTLGDKVALWFRLEQDIDNLNGDEKLVISEDTNGYDKYFQTEKTNRGRGSLVIKKTDYQNSKQTPAEYNDYLKSKTVGAETEVELFEEGDYEVALDYEISERKANIFGWEPIHAYTNYRIFFKFSVRNGNCMVYPFDVTTKAELINNSMTVNGFYLDLSKSRYLDINVKKSMLVEGADDLSEDTRFNRPAKDGDQYTDEGVYTITVQNRYTGEQTEKRIYVGSDNIIRAYITTGLSIRDIKKQVALGAEITNSGRIVPPPQAPMIVTDITTDEITYTEGISATELYVKAVSNDGGAVSYDWYKNETNSVTGGIKLDAHSPNYTPPTTESGTTYYYCVVTNTVNGREVETNSAIAKITVVAVVETPPDLDAPTPDTDVSTPELDTSVPAVTTFAPESTTVPETLTPPPTSGTPSEEITGTEIGAASAIPIITAICAVVVVGVIVIIFRTKIASVFSALLKKGE